ncbi:bifunctional phosphoribosyl-AMP cyclohydrolase/phosphoribosyl-ATP diphosphatase HisIE [Anaerocolumna sp. AGMB13020]|uniref:bifunctional phosphoribosyl-AMP cyclohydrolase/phosphoribosyl-ATP diphosphatase HisIE n=1 Tax=Anaerocolumna sp. AGMB13020 TaxID=3081750 RepID=UPI002955987E|nr:bifunctional phosphoribosyl-AMP cyclohydrolase/phosphoribosyl-ATP diphosphatase HisIE [Anaerocolumna sp. AGMB13020]WOO36608.1 bifunctional phosphoribosyl-AMP cyclohydrolase/phosphoribosyl-ATP diphosphatase HisIE [Anaerocolumna sp. AGMB13020]
MYKKIVPWLVYEKDKAEDFIEAGIQYEAAGADELYISAETQDHNLSEEFLKAVLELTKQIDIPILINIFAERFEDVKKALYTGAYAVTVKLTDIYEVNTRAGAEAGNKAIKEAVARFGREKLYLEVGDKEDALTVKALASELGVDRLLLVKTGSGNDFNAFSKQFLGGYKKHFIKNESFAGVDNTDLNAFLSEDKIEGLVSVNFGYRDLQRYKNDLKKRGISVNTYESNISFADMKLNSEGLLPVVVQDYKTKDVLMVAYMNEEAFSLTVSTGRMTYYSRSRKKLWIKGETSGHFQYIKVLTLDCDKDTLLAKVRQVGPACHTGSQSCFFEEVITRPYNDTNPLTVLQDVFGIIRDRKEHPKEGSYTNYLFTKGIDKILKKCGEEAAEIIIAAKNPDTSELKYEISDFLYHMMVLMAQCGLSWEEVTKELVHRK